MLFGGTLPAHDSSAAERVGVERQEQDSREYNPDLAILSSASSRTSDIAGVIVTMPGSSTHLSETAVKEKIHDISTAFTRSTAGFKSIGEVSLQQLQLRPESDTKRTIKDLRFKPDAGRPCYTRAQIRELAAKTYAENTYTKNSSYYRKILPTIIVADASICPDEKGTFVAGIASRVDDRPYVAVNYETNVEELLAHEYGHIFFGLGHQGVLKCEARGFLRDSIQNMVAGKQGCRPITYRNGAGKDEVNQYASDYSTMGMSKPLFAGPLFTGLEVAEVNSAMHVDGVLPVSSDYEISAKYGGRLGIRFTLPVNHALREIVPDARAVAIVLAAGPAEQNQDYTDLQSANWGFVPIVEREDGRTSLVIRELYARPQGQAETLSHVRTFDEAYDYPIVYHDAELGVAVIASRKDDDYMLHVRNDDDPLVVRVRNIMSDQYNSRMQLH